MWITPYETIWDKWPDLWHVQTFYSHANMHKSKEAGRRMLDSRALPGILVGYCRANVCRVLLDDGNIFVLSRDERIVEVIGPDRASNIDSDVIAFDLFDGSILSNDSVPEAEPSSEED